MGLWAWFVRLLGLTPTRSQDSPASPGSSVTMSASHVLGLVRELQKANAQWPEIWQTLNPDGDVQTQQLLIELRGPYMFAPHVALNVLTVGCERAIGWSAQAGRLAALQAALGADDRIVRPR
jgi:hypothetical protein